MMTIHLRFNVRVRSVPSVLAPAYAQYIFLLFIHFSRPISYAKMSSSIATPGQNHIWVSVSQPILCTASALAFSTAAPVPTGAVYIS